MTDDTEKDLAVVWAEPRRPYDIAYDLRMSAPPPPMFGLCLETSLPHVLARLRALGFEPPTA